jgi:hypothetical protein
MERGRTDRVKRTSVGIDFLRGSDARATKRPTVCKDEVCDAVSCGYHRQPEYKFLGGGWNEEGVLRLACSERQIAPGEQTPSRTRAS